MKYFIFFLVFLLSCGVSAPRRSDYPCEEGFAQADCLYRNQKNSDKTVCVPLVEIYRDRLKEEQRLRRLEYCRDKRPSDMTERECRSWLNEK